ncbi:MAG: glycosyltransferase family 4 protein [Candidatus Muiribacteriaceae bacterium]
MKILVISHTSVVSEYRKRFQYLAQSDPDIKLRVIVPDQWLEMNRWIKTHQQGFDKAYDLRIFRPIRFFRKKPLLNTTYFFPQLVKEMLDFRPDIIDIIEEPYSLITTYAIFLNKILKINAKICFFSAQNIYKTFPFPFNLLERYVLDNADMAFPISRDVEEILRQKGYCNKTTVIPLGTENIESENVGKEKNIIRIGFIGRLEYSKGVDLFLKTAEKMRRHSDIVFHIAGSGSMEEDVKKVCLEYPNVIYEGFLSNKNTYDYYRRMHIIIVPSRTMKNWKEQFGRVIVEAMAYNCIVIGSDSGEIPNVIGDEDLVFGEDNEDLIYEKLLEIIEKINDNEFIRSYGDTIRSNLKKYSWESITETILSSYNSLR